ncbi:putative SegB homing endonuclease [Tetrasphaera phage TJE1]|uniref:Putative SegB homing endonuclease n=1 Tax=Tetrasphaera phage TJE1 TaxID=981335 RepID=G4W967_9CAUD|nr:homing endonuclease [Tetrasphaera phage TJE1]ADX42555.1 putative SegB homing endonuclease [Tetrasphaera phage TJE1]
MPEEVRMTSSIYCIRNRLNGKMYIGKSVNVDRRVVQHFKPSSGCVGLARAIKKHGKESFEWEVLQDGIPEHLVNDLESFFIWHFKTLAPSGYNMTGGGDGFDSDALRIRSENVEWKESMVARNRRMASDPAWIARNAEQATDVEWKRNHAKGLERRASNPEWLAKVGKGPGGGPKTQEALANISEGNRRKAKDPVWLSKTREASRKRGKPVVCVETGMVFESISRATTETGIHGSTIIQACRGTQKRKSASGYHWRYATQEESESARRGILHG